MLDANSRYAIATRMNEERLAEARRSHLLRAARQDRDEFEVRRPVARAAHGRNILAGAVEAIRHGLTHGPAHRIQGAGVR